MILNIAATTGHFLLVIVDKEAEATLKKMRAKETPELRNRLNHLGTLKHRLEYNLGFKKPFRGPIDWGFPYDGKPLR